MPPSSSSLQRGTRTSVPRRMGMRKWLELLLDNGQCEGLEWENKPMKTFSIVWKHASSHGFDHSKHADVFIQWARYKGRTAVKEERNQKKKKGDKYDSKYKSNFRCALHSLIDCIEIPSDEDSPKKFFQFISPSDPQYKERRERKRERNCHNKKAQKRTHDGNFSEGQTSSHTIDFIKHEPKEGSESNESNVLTLQEKEYGHHVEESVFKEIKANDSTFSETQKTSHIMDVKKDELKEFSQNEIMTNQESTVGTALEGNRNTIESFQEIPHHLSGQSAHTSTFHELGDVVLPIITLQPKERTGQVEMIFGKTSQESSSSLPNFEALGVKDQYGPKTYNSSMLLASGGDMQVKKVAEEKTEFAEPITVGGPQSKTGNSVTTLGLSQPSDINSFNMVELSHANNTKPVSTMELSQTNNVGPVSSVELSQTNNGNSVITEFVLANTSEDEGNFLFALSENSQVTDVSVSDDMYLSQDQEPFDNSFLPCQAESGVITTANSILNNSELQLLENVELDFISDPEFPYYYGPF